MNINVLLRIWIFCAVMITPMAIVYSIPLQRGRDLLTTALDKIGAFTERLNMLPLYIFPIALLGYTVCVIGLVLLAPFIVLYFLRRSE